MNNVTVTAMMFSSAMIGKISKEELNLDFNNIQVVSIYGEYGNFFNILNIRRETGILVSRKHISDVLNKPVYTKKYLLFYNDIDLKDYDGELVKHILTDIKYIDDLDIKTLVYKDLLKSYNIKKVKVSLDNIYKGIVMEVSKRRSVKIPRYIEDINMNVFDNKINTNEYSKKKLCEVLLQPKPLNTKLIDDAITASLLEEILEIYPFSKHQDIYLSYFSIKKYDLNNKIKLGKKIFKEEG